MQNKYKLIFRYVLLFALVQFPLKMTGSLRYLAYIISYIIPLIYLFCNLYRTIELYKRGKNLRISIFKLIFAFLLIVTLLWPIILGTFDFTYLISYWSGMLLWLVKYTFLVVYFEKQIDKNRSIELFAEYFVASIAIYVMVSLVWCIPGIRNIMTNFIYLSSTDIRNLQRAEYYTRFGWSGWTSFNETVICSIAVLILCILIIKNSENSKLQRHYLLLSLFPIIGNALFGRIGLLASVVCLAFTCFFVILKGNIKYLLITIAIVVGGSFLIIALKDKITIIKNWYNWVFSAFEAYRRTGMFYDNVGSVQHLTIDMYWMPEIETFLFGDGYYTGADGAYYLHTDSGIMRPMLFYGIINYALSIIGVLFLLREFSKDFFMGTKRKNIFLGMVLSVMSVAVFEFKGESLWMFIAIIFPLIMLMRYGSGAGNYEC